MSIELVITTAMQVVEKLDSQDVIQFLLVCTFLVLLTMVYRAWDAKLGPRASPPRLRPAARPSRRRGGRSR